MFARGPVTCERVLPPVFAPPLTAFLRRVPRASAAVAAPALGVITLVPRVPCADWLACFEQIDDVTKVLLGLDDRQQAQLFRRKLNHRSDQQRQSISLCLTI